MRVIFLMCGKGHKQSKKCFILFVPSFSFAILYLLSISVNYRYNDNAIGFNQLTFPVSSTINKVILYCKSYVIIVSMVKLSQMGGSTQNKLLKVFFMSFIYIYVLLLCVKPAHEKIKGSHNKMCLKINFSLNGVFLFKKFLF